MRNVSIILPSLLTSAASTAPTGSVVSTVRRLTAPDPAKVARRCDNSADREESKRANFPKLERRLMIFDSTLFAVFSSCVPLEDSPTTNRDGRCWAVSKAAHRPRAQTTAEVLCNIRSLLRQF